MTQLESLTCLSLVERNVLKTLKLGEDFHSTVFYWSRPDTTSYQDRYRAVKRLPQSSFTLLSDCFCRFLSFLFPSSSVFLPLSSLWLLGFFYLPSFSPEELYFGGFIQRVLGSLEAIHEVQIPSLQILNWEFLI